MNMVEYSIVFWFLFFAAAIAATLLLGYEGAK